MAGSTPTSSAFLGAVHWIEQILLGSIATSVAILAIAVLGLLMLSGRLPFKRGATVVVGCFILFSASTVASGLLAAIGDGTQGEPIAATVPAPAYLPASPRPMPRDPNAGASVSDQRTTDIFR